MNEYLLKSKVTTSTDRMLLNLRQILQKCALTPPQPKSTQMWIFTIIIFEMFNNFHHKNVNKISCLAAHFLLFEYLVTFKYFLSFPSYSFPFHTFLCISVLEIIRIYAFKCLSNSYRIEYKVSLICSLCCWKKFGCGFVINS
jgi:hypothetical protein